MDKLFSKKLQIVYFYTLVFICCLSFCIMSAKIDPDFWSRLIMGRNVCLFGEVIKNDFISYTDTHIWYDHEWISSAIFYTVLKYLGAFGLILLKAFLGFLTILFVDLIIIQNQKTFFYKYKLLYMFIFILLLSHIKFFSSLRCQDFTFVFYPLLILILERYRLNTKSNLIYFTPLLILFWLNSHGGVLAGIGIIVLYLFASLIQKAHFKKLLIILPISLMMFFINPWGIDFIPFMYKAIVLQRSYIGEWQSPFTMESQLVVIFLLNVITIIFIYIYPLIMGHKKIKELNLTKLFMLLATFILALRFIKHNYIFFITCFSFLYEEFKFLCDDIEGLFKYLFNKTFSLNIPLIVVYILLPLVLFIKYPINSYYENSKDELPIKPLQFLHDNEIKGKIFAPYYMSGFIAYKEYPNLKIYMDGRQEQVYDIELHKNEMNFLFYKSDDAHKFLEKNLPDVILLENYWKAMEFMNWQDYYKKVYEDSKYVIYFHPNLVKEIYNYVPKTTYFDEKEIYKSKFFD